MNEMELRHNMVSLGKSLFDRGYVVGGAGNMSIRIDDNRFLATPSGSCMGRLDPESLSIVDGEGNAISGDKASKEVQFHLALYRGNSEFGSVVHTHSTWLTLLSCQSDLDQETPIRAMTPYFVMKIGTLPVVRYYPPGNIGLARDLGDLAGRARSFLLQNHGPVVTGKNLFEAIDNLEELEETAKLAILSRGMNIRYLSIDEISVLKS